ncbi:hypothetical protein [Deinococcus sp. ME38]|uniref:hypothetical protein n=1 Tax=Deinococcus sp. ME38 TaxID=3400344 RepID=UPI003B5BDB34
MTVVFNCMAGIAQYPGQKRPRSAADEMWDAPLAPELKREALRGPRRVMNRRSTGTCGQSAG